MSSIKSDPKIKEPTDSSVKFRANFNYVLKNIQSIRASKKLKLFKLDLDSDTSTAPTASNTSNNLGLDLQNTTTNGLDLDDNEDNDINEIDLKIKGENEINKCICGQKFKTIMESLNTINSLKEITFEQIICLIQTFKEELKEISCHQNNSIFARIHQNSGFPGIIGSIQLSLFSKSQKSFILGCLYGLFPNDNRIGQKLFAVLFPETLVRIAMKFKNIDYETALELLKPTNKSNI